MTKTNRLTTQQLADMRNRADNALDGPWKVADDNRDTEYSPFWVIGGDPEVYDGEWYAELHVGVKDDATFIANARQDVPSLITEVEALIAEKAQARRKLDATSGILLEYIRQGQSHVSIEVMQTLVDHLRKDLLDHGA